MPPLIHKFFLIPENFRKTEGFLFKAFRFGHVRQKFPIKPWCPPSPLLCMKIFDKRIFLKHQSALQWNISVQWDKNFSTGNLDTPPFPSYPNFFDTRNIATVKDSPTEIFGTVRQKIFDGKSWYSPHPLIQTFSIPEIIETLKDSPLRKFSALWDKKFSIENLETPPPPPLLFKLFRYPKLSKH